MEEEYMRLCLLLVLGLGSVSCMKSNVFSTLDNDAPKSAEQKAADLLGRGKGAEAQKILEKKLSPAMLSSINKGNPLELMQKITSASAEEKATTLPLLATSYAAKQKVEVADILHAAAVAKDKGEGGGMTAILGSLPADYKAAEDDIRKARDISQALVFSGANTSSSAVLAALSYTLADFGNRSRKVTNGNKTMTVSKAEAAKVSSSDIGEIFKDMEHSLAICAAIAKTGKKDADELAHSIKNNLETIEKFSGATRDARYRAFISRQ
jgi:hypothetical protein